jgi:hypothetical protein
MELEIQCSVCEALLDEHQHLPLILPNCGDTVCKSCLAKSVAEREDHPSFNCPVCKRKYEIDDPSNFQMVEVFPKNQLVLNIIAGHQRTKNAGTCEKHNLSRQLVCFADTCDRKVPFCESCQSESHPNCNSPFIVRLEDVSNLVKKEKIASESNATMAHLADELNIETERVLDGVQYALNTLYAKTQEDIEELRELSLPNVRHILSLLNATIDPQAGRLQFRLKAVDEAEDLIHKLKRRINALFSEFPDETTLAKFDDFDAKPVRHVPVTDATNYPLKHKLVKSLSNSGTLNPPSYQINFPEHIPVDAKTRQHQIHHSPSKVSKPRSQLEDHPSQNNVKPSKYIPDNSMSIDTIKQKEPKSSSREPILESTMTVTPDIKLFIDDIKNFFSDRRNFELLFKNRIDLSESIRPLPDSLKLFLVKYVKRVGTRSNDARSRWKHIWSLIFSKDEFPDIFESSILKNNPIYIIIRRNSKGKMIYKVFDLFSYDMQLYINKCLEK